jgi:hypothetical protein
MMQSSLSPEDPCTPTECTYPVETTVAGEIETPDTMPYVEDDEEDDEEAPENMPYAGDNEQATDQPMFIQRLIQRLIEAAEKFGCAEPSEGCVPCSEGDQTDDEPQATEDEPMDDEEPDYHGQHCPRMITCPYSGRSYEAEPEPMPETKKKKKSKKKDLDSMEFRPGDADPQSYPQ